MTGVAGFFQLPALTVQNAHSLGGVLRRKLAGDEQEKQSPQQLGIGFSEPLQQGFGLSTSSGYKQNFRTEVSVFVVLSPLFLPYFHLLLLFFPSFFKYLIQ